MFWTVPWQAPRGCTVKLPNLNGAPVTHRFETRHVVPKLSFTGAPPTHDEGTVPSMVAFVTPHSRWAPKCISRIFVGGFRTLCCGKCKTHNTHSQLAN